MKRMLLTAVVLPLFLIMPGCPPVEVTARDAIVGTRAFLQSVKPNHLECGHDVNGRWVSLHTATSVCKGIDKAVASKDLAIDALEIWCAGPQFEAGGPCQAPKKGEPRYQQLFDKLNAAVALMNQTKADVQALTGGK